MPSISTIYQEFSEHVRPRGWREDVTGNNYSAAALKEKSERENCVGRLVLLHSSSFYPFFLVCRHALGKDFDLGWIKICGWIICGHVMPWSRSFNKVLVWSLSVIWCGHRRQENKHCGMTSFKMLLQLAVVLMMVVMHFASASDNQCPVECSCLGSIVECERLQLVAAPNGLPPWTENL